MRFPNRVNSIQTEGDASSAAKCSPLSPNAMASPSSPTSPRADAASYPTSGIFALGYLDDTYPHEKIGSKPTLTHASTAPLPTPPGVNRHTTWSTSTGVNHHGSTQSNSGVCKKKKCKAHCNHPKLLKGMPTTLRNSHTFGNDSIISDIATIGHIAHEKLSGLHDSLSDSLHSHQTPPQPPIAAGLPGPNYYNGVHTCDIPHCQFNSNQPPQLTAKQKRHMKRVEEREIIAITLDTLLQIAAFTTAVVFGIWAVRSYNIAVTTLQVQYVANQLSLRSLCSSGNSTLENDPVCQVILQQTVSQLLDSELSTDVLPNIGKVAEPGQPVEHHGKKLSLGGIVGIVFGVVAFILGNLALAAWRRFAMLRKVNRHIGTANCVEE